MRWIDLLAETFGGLPFLLTFNFSSLAWVLLGIFDPHFPDPYPSNFYTLTVSWLAINMSSLVLWSERRRREREEALEQADRRLLKAMHALLSKAEHDLDRNKETQKIILSLLESQMQVIERLKEDDKHGQRGSADCS